MAARVVRAGADADARPSRRRPTPAWTDRTRRGLHRAGGRLPAGAAGRAGRPGRGGGPCRLARPGRRRARGHACARCATRRGCEPRAGVRPGWARASGRGASRSGADVLQAFGADAASADPQHFVAGARAGRRAALAGRPAATGARPAGARRRAAQSAAATGAPSRTRSRFFSFRRDGVTGRMAAAIWLRALTRRLLGAARAPRARCGASACPSRTARSTAAARRTARR